MAQRRNRNVSATVQPNSNDTGLQLNVDVLSDDFLLFTGSFTTLELEDAFDACPFWWSDETPYEDNRERSNGGTYDLVIAQASCANWEDSVGICLNAALANFSPEELFVNPAEGDFRVHPDRRLQKIAGEEYAEVV